MTVRWSEAVLKPDQKIPRFKIFKGKSHTFNHVKKKVIFVMELGECLLKEDGIKSFKKKKFARPLATHWAVPHSRFSKGISFIELETILIA